MIVNAEALRIPLADDTVDACLTSPPYWGGLRVYDGPQGRLWPALSYSPMPGLPPVDVPEQVVSLGHEPDPLAFVAHLLLIFREVRRVLRPGACLAVNLGDCYSSSPSGQNGIGGALCAAGWGGDFQSYRKDASSGRTDRRGAGLAPKNLLLMPWRLALAMQAEGWVLRSRMPGGAEVLPSDDVGIEPDIVWRKRACMPESVRDRPTVDFEDVIIFSQGPRYFWDQEAGREGWSDSRRGASGDSLYAYGTAAGRRDGNCPSSTLATGSGASGRNMRSVWTINHEPTAEEHFAAWPTALAARLIRVMTSERGVCPECGAPWVRQVEIGGLEASDGRNRYGFYATRRDPSIGAGTHYESGPGGTASKPRRIRKPIGWAPSCGHLSDPVPAIVLDPFAGLGRTWEAARATGRRFVGTELGMGYCRLAVSRNDVEGMLRRRIAERGKTIAGPLFGDPPLPDGAAEE